MADTTIPTPIIDAIRLQSGRDDAVIKATDRLIDDLGLDSLDVVALAVELEDTPLFPRKINDDEIDGWQTVADLVASSQRGN